MLPLTQSVVPSTPHHGAQDDDVYMHVGSYAVPPATEASTNHSLPYNPLRPSTRTHADPYTTHSNYVLFFYPKKSRNHTSEKADPTCILTTATVR